MRRLAQRTIASMLLVVLLMTGFGLYVVRYIIQGDDWAAFGVNRHAYNSSGVLARGAIVDANGVVLAYVDGDQRKFSGDYTTRRATLHVVGDAAGNIGTGLLSAFDTQLMGYNFVGGLYSITGVGNTVHTTIDAELCVAAYNAMEGRKGAVVVYNYKTGEVMCMVSTPGFDPYDPPVIEEGDARYDGAYINRAVSSTFTPGSIYKVLTLAAALENIPDLEERTFHCDGYYTIGYDVITCTDAHGDIDIHDAFARSCNCAFAQIALEVGGDAIYQQVRAAGLTDRLSMSGIPVAAGRFDVPEDGTSDLAWAGIGQYNDLANPLAVARYMGAIANGGSVVDPRIVTKVVSPIGIPVALYGRGTKSRLLAADTADALREMMRYNVTEYYGEYSFPGLNICAKSGTAEVGEGLRPHGWFVGFLDDPDHPYAFAVIVENGGWGFTAAGAVANQVLQAAVRKE